MFFLLKYLEVKENITNFMARNKKTSIQLSCQ